MTLQAIRARLVLWRLTHSAQISNFTNVPKSLVITLIGALLAALLYLPSSQRLISQYRSIDTIFIAAGGMIGTIIALIFSLSIIVVQRAAETFTPFITRLYREDWKTHLIFVVLVVLCLISFLFSIDGIAFGLTQTRLLPIQIVIIALTYDLSRLQYRRVSQLMDTNEALNILLRKMFRHIDGIQKDVNKLAKQLRVALLTDKTEDMPIENFETVVYQSSPLYTDLLAIGLGEMAELATRAISKGEIHTAQKAISSISALAVYYLNSRKANIALFPAPTQPFSGVIVGDVDRILDPVYEHLMEINRRAVENKSQTISIEVVECLGRIGVHLLSIGEKSQRIAWKPIGYLGFCVTTAQAAHLHDVALRSSDALLRFGKAIPEDNLDIRIYIPVIELWRDITMRALIAQNPTTADLVLKDTMSLLEHILKKKLKLFEQAFSLTLDEIYRLVPLCVANEGPFGGPFAPYQMTNLRSVGWLISHAAKLTVKEQDEWNNPYNDFIELNEKLSAHFRHIGTNVDIGMSRLVWEISETIKHVSDVFLHLLEHPLTENKSFIGDLVNRIRWYITFFWNAFDKAEKINHYYAYSACDQIGQICLAFCEQGFLEIVESGTSAIRSIAVSYSKKGEKRSPYQVADLLEIIWHVRMFAEAKNDSGTVRMIDEQLSNSKLWEGEAGEFLGQAFEERKYRLKQELVDLNSSPPLDDSTSLLRRLLQEDHPNVLQKILEELYGRSP
ncbi:MAG TPA: hypothetical protein VEM96_08800 [Pyrinomonadaceae bacterium]|nr:hypothetical protein [Pyrinomonadaceae bacterium]